MVRLIKLSAPGWEKEFETEDEARKELYNYICRDCREGDGVDENSEIAHMLWTACGAEFMTEDDSDDELVSEDVVQLLAEEAGFKFCDGFIYCGKASAPEYEFPALKRFADLVARHVLAKQNNGVQ